MTTIGATHNESALYCVAVATKSASDFALPDVGRRGKEGDGPWLGAGIKVLKKLTNALSS